MTILFFQLILGFMAESQDVLGWHCNWPNLYKEDHLMVTCDIWRLVCVSNIEGGGEVLVDTVMVAEDPLSFSPTFSFNDFISDAFLDIMMDLDSFI